MADELKPCPFCGAAGQHVYFNIAHDPHYAVVCTNSACDAKGPRAPIMTDEDTAAWNRRTNEDRRDG